MPENDLKFLRSVSGIYTTIVALARRVNYLKVLGEYEKAALLEAELNARIEELYRGVDHESKRITD